MTIYLLWLISTVVFIYNILLWTDTNTDNIILSKYYNSNINENEKIAYSSEVVYTSENPIISWWTSGSISREFKTIHCSSKTKCDVYAKVKSDKVGAYMFFGSNIIFTELPLPRRPNVIWALHHLESPIEILEFLHERGLSVFNYSSTFSRYSDFPLPLQFVDSLDTMKSKKYFVETAVKNLLLSKLSPVIYLQSNCDTFTERDTYVEKLMEYIQIDSYGACLKNNGMPRELTLDYFKKLNQVKFLRFIARYKFVIAIENAVCDDYLTEKFWRAIKVGTVPIYFGSPTIRDWMPNNKSAILLQDFPTPELMSEHLKKLILNDSLYEEYLEHKTKGLISNIGLVEELKRRPYQNDIVKRQEMFECFICEKLYDKFKVIKEIKVKTVTKSHFNCPKPVSALTQTVNPLNVWVKFWETAKGSAEELYKKVMYCVPV